MYDLLIIVFICGLVVALPVCWAVAEKISGVIANCDHSVSELKNIKDKANFLQQSIVSKGRTTDGGNALLAFAGDIFELAQLTVEKEHVVAKEAYCDPLRHSLLTLLRKEDVLPIECSEDANLAIMLKGYYQWKV